MKIGTRSLLFGVHQILWHPWTVYRAWCSLYGRPSWREMLCIFIHDWGYWGLPNMDGPEGKRHPMLGGKIAGKLFGPEYAELVLLHSRHYAKLVGKEPSRLCWADKLSILYDPKWFYLLRARMSGEINEYRKNAMPWIPPDIPHGLWFDWIKVNFEKLAKERQ